MSDEEKEFVGSVAEEAVKLLGALQDWARDSGNDAAGAAAGVASAFRSFDEHIATGGQDCKYCPLCQLVSAFRQTSPDVKQHLGSAVTSLFQALCSILASQPSSPGTTGTPDGRLQKIDLVDPGADD